MNPNPTPTPTAEQRPTPEENPLASFDGLVRAIDGKPTGKFQLQVGELIVYSDEWNAAKAEKWMPLIVSAVNSHAALERRNAELAEALGRLVRLLNLRDSLNHITSDPRIWNNMCVDLHDARTTAAALAGEKEGK